MAYISVKNLVKKYPNGNVEVVVLNDISFDVQKGESVAIVGPSGSGKSTLLSILGSLEVPTSGKVEVEGQNILALTAEEIDLFRNQTLGFVFQAHHLLNQFTVFENVMMPIEIAGGDVKRAQKRYEYLLEVCGLESKSKTIVNLLSGGEKQRVAIMRAMIHDPKLILADEPTGNLDAQTGGKVFDLLLSLNRELKTTLFMVTHNEGLAYKLDRKLILINGKIQ